MTENKAVKIRLWNRYDFLLLLAFLFSGVAALGYELLWTRLLSLVFGVETVGVLGVLAGFFGGMVVGAFVFHSRARRAGNPILLFAKLEIAAAAFAVLSPYLLNWLKHWVPVMIGKLAGNGGNAVDLISSLAISTVVLLPATVCMGATFACLVEARRRILPEGTGGRGLGRLYAANTLGAAFGVFVSIYLILPEYGFYVSSILLALIGVLSAALAILWSKGKDLSCTTMESAPKAEICTEDNRAFKCPPRLVYVLLFITGFAGLGYEISVIGIVSRVFENTVYTFANILAVYLFGTAIGAWGYQLFLRSNSKPHVSWIVAVLMLALASSVAIVSFELSYCVSIYRALLPAEPSYADYIVAELLVSCAIFFIPTVLMGALFSHLMGLIADRGIGNAYGVNTLGATLAPFVFGLLFAKHFGYLNGLYLVMFLYLAGYCIYVYKDSRKKTRLIAGVVSTTMLWFFVPSSVNLIGLQEGWKVIDSKDGLYGTVTVVEKVGSKTLWRTPWRRLKVNRRFKMGGGQGFAEKRIGHAAMLMAPNAQKALFLGIGTGITLGSVKQYNLEKVDAIEIIPEVIDMLPWFDKINNGVRELSQIEFHAADARRYVAASTNKYDIIVADLYHPGRDGASFLYSKEHFEALGRHLTDNGVVAQWLPMHQLNLENLKIVIRTFVEVFPEVHSFIGTYNATVPVLLLVGANKSELTLDYELLERNISPGTLASKVIEYPQDMLSAYVTDKKGLEDFVQGAEINTDMNPVILFSAAENAYNQTPELAYGNLNAILRHRKLFPEYLVKFKNREKAKNFRKTVTKKKKAIEYYLQAELIRLKAGDGMVSHHVLENYIHAYIEDPDFSPARGALLRLARSDGDFASRIIPYLIERDRRKL
ncbi:MAG: hypothetical protein GY847_39260 [Proteobacteria bacterium]|nr:hypothetical protein [Pseudomonadota bacterium]